MTRSIRIGHLYPETMNLYGDKGNLTTLVQRAQWRGIDVHVKPLLLGEKFDLSSLDLLFCGGDQDRAQTRVANDLIPRAEQFQAQVADGLPMLVVCGSYQLFGRAYFAGDGAVLPGIGVFDHTTRHPGFKARRCVGNITVDWDGYTLVGFENHGGRTTLGRDVQPLGTVIAGWGNNGEDGTEGAMVHNTFGTYLHGSLLPKNPKLADHLLALALKRAGHSTELAPLDDSIEDQARKIAIARAERDALHAKPWSIFSRYKSYYLGRRLTSPVAPRTRLGAADGGGNTHN